MVAKLRRALPSLDLAKSDAAEERPKTSEMDRFQNSTSPGPVRRSRGSCALRATENCACCGRLDVEGPGWKELAEIYAASSPRVAKNILEESSPEFFGKDIVDKNFPCW